MTPAQRAVIRIREEMTERKISQRDLASLLKCSQGRVAKMLNGGVQLRVNDLATLAGAVGITLVEAIRDRGLEFFAEMTPTEVRILERMRRRPHLLEGVTILLELKGVSKQEPRVPKRRRPGRPLHSESKEKGA